MAQILGGALAALAGSLAVWRLTRGSRVYRVGPWPGLSVHGAALLLAHALLLAGLDTLLGRPDQPLPDLVLLAAATLVPLVLATRLVYAPGTASAVCGAYLLPRSLVSLVAPDVALPSLLLVASMSFDVVAWARRADLPSLAFGRRRKRRVWTLRTPGPRVITPRRAALAGASYGFSLALIEPGFAQSLGSPATAWPVPHCAIAAVTAAAVCAAIGLFSDRGRALRRPRSPTG